MTTEQEQKLKRFLAGRLRKDVRVNSRGELWWNEGDYSEEIKDTEMLDLCHRIEMGLSDEKLVKYDLLLGITVSKQTFDYTNRIPNKGQFALRATWQQRTTALAELFGEEI